MTVARILDWYARHARPLPWREPGTTAWAVLVSEVMLQQTPVNRVLPVWEAWILRWPTPASLADEDAGEAVRAWGRLGYPRRAKRLHEAATAIRDRHDGAVPDDLPRLLALPGVGDYTAAAVASFAFGQRHVVLDTNVRRVLARIGDGAEFPPDSLTASEKASASAWVPAEPARAASWAVASMELGALICTARNPHCDTCPVATHCAWNTSGRPRWNGPPRRGQTYAGTDRQCRGVVLALLREAPDGTFRENVLAAWPTDPTQAIRALESLLTDGLIRVDEDGRLRL